MTRLFRLKFSFVHACRRRMRTHDVRYSLSSVRWLARPRPSTVIFLGADGYQSRPRSAYVKTVRSYFVCNEREKRETRNEIRRKQRKDTTTTIKTTTFYCCLEVVHTYPLHHVVVSRNSVVVSRHSKAVDIAWNLEIRVCFQ